MTNSPLCCFAFQVSLTASATTYDRGVNTDVVTVALEGWPLQRYYCCTTICSNLLIVFCSRLDKFPSGLRSS